MAKKKPVGHEDAATVIGTKENNASGDRHALLKSRLKVAKAWCKKPHQAWRKWLGEYEIDNLADTEEIRDKVRIGYIFRKTESELPAIFDDQPELYIKGRNTDLKALEPMFAGAYDYLWDIQDLESKIEDAGLYFVLTGMGFVSSPWLTKTKEVKEMIEAPIVDEMGQQIGVEPQEQVYTVPLYDAPDATVLDPFKVYFSPETKFGAVLDYEHCPYYFEEMVMSKEEVKARFGKDVEPNEKMHVGETETDSEIESEMAHHKDDFQRITVYRYYGCLPEDKAKGIQSSESWKYDKDYLIYMTDKEELYAEECPYHVKPLFIIGNYGPANKFWKFGDAKHLMPLVQELEQYRSQILGHTRKMANPKPLIEISSEVDEEAFRDPRHGRIVKYSGIAPTYLSPSTLGPEVATGVEMARTDLEKTGPSFDLAQGGGQSQVKSPRGIQVYSEASDRSVRRKRKKIARFIRQLMMFQFSQLAQNWNPEEGKTLTVDGQEEPITPEVLQVLGDPQVLNKIDIEIESLSINRVQMKQDALELWDIAAQHPDIFNVLEIAHDLLQNGYQKRDADRYLVSMEQQVMAIIQKFLQALAQFNPELAAQVAQYAQSPELMQLLANDPQQQQQGDPNAMPTEEQEQTQGGLPPMGQLGA